MDPSLVVLDNLERQLTSGAITVSIACKKIEFLLNEAAREEAGRYFYQITPRLLNLIIGHKQKTYILHP
jgi:hypothetical protein